MSSGTCLATRRFIVSLAAALAALPGLAEEFNMEVTTVGIRPGAHVAGPTLSADAITNRVVLLEFWGVNCPPCIRSMPMLEELHQTLGPHGLIVIGAHAQGGSAADLRPQVAKLGVTFTILEDARVEGGTDFQGIPHCMLFDHTGKCLFRGSPFKVHDAVVAAVKADTLQRCVVLFKGTHLGAEAAKLNGEWKKDKPFQASVKACQQLAKLERMRDYVREQLGIDADATVTSEQAAAIPGEMKSQIRAVAQGIGKSCPGSSLAEKAAVIAAELAATP